MLAGTVVLGLLLRAGFTGRLPLTFAVIALVSLAVLLLGWRALSLAVAHRAASGCAEGRPGRGPTLAACLPARCSPPAR